MLQRCRRWMTHFHKLVLLLVHVLVYRVRYDIGQFTLVACTYPFRIAWQALRRAGEAARRQRLYVQHQKRPQQKQQLTRISPPKSPTMHNRSPNPHATQGRVSSLCSTSSVQCHDQGQGGSQHASGVWSDPASLEKVCWRGFVWRRVLTS